MEGQDQVFDEFVRKQFSGEMAAPPASVEEGVFAALDRSSLSRSWGRAAGVVLVAVAMAVGIWNLDSDPSSDSVTPLEETHEMPLDTDAATVSSSPEANAMEDLPAALETQSNHLPASVATTSLATRVSASAEPRLDVAPLDALEADKIRTNIPDSNVLQESAGESWVMPAHIQVKE